MLLFLNGILCQHTSCHVLSRTQGCVLAALNVAQAAQLSELKWRMLTDFLWVIRINHAVPHPPAQNPWIAINGTVMKLKPHKCQDQAYQELLQLQQREGKLKLMHFRRVKQLGAGDVGLVDLVQLQVRWLVD